MNDRRFIEELVHEVSPDASVVDVTDTGGDVVVTLAGTTTVTARCEMSRSALDRAETRRGSRRRLASVLEACADATVAYVPDGRS